jgi:hypothetical protein
MYATGVVRRSSARFGIFGERSVGARRPARRGGGDGKGQRTRSGRVSRSASRSARTTRFAAIARLRVSGPERGLGGLGNADAHGSRVEPRSAAGSGSRNRRGNARDRRIRAATHLRDALSVGFRARRGPVRHGSGGHARGVLLVVPPNRTVMRSRRPRARVRAGRNHPRRARGRQTRGLTGRARYEVTRFAAAATRRRAKCVCGRDRGPAGDRAVREKGYVNGPKRIFLRRFAPDS